jgi:hypothetical protein
MAASTALDHHLIRAALRLSPGGYDIFAVTIFVGTATSEIDACL